MSKFKSYSEEQLKHHYDQFLINSWSYSKTSAFSRNQKSFEMQYIYGYRSKSAPTTVAGNAYHAALEMYFKAIKDKTELPGLVELTVIANNYIDEFDTQLWKLQKTSPTIAECVEKASKTATALIENFFKEISIYTEEVAEVLDVEVYGSEFVTVNGVDIPLPLNYRMDEVVRLINGKVIGIDHKSKGQFTGEADIALAVGKQAITYAIGYEASTGIKIDEVWFMENKYSQNRDKSPQIAKYVIDICNVDIRRYYEAMLYEPLRALIQAVNDPDYVYVMNDSDNLSDLAELYQFWNKTLINDVEDFNIDPSKKTLIEKRLKKIKDSGVKSINPNIIREFQKNASQFIQYDYQNSNMTKEEKIEHALRTFGIIIEVGHVFDGYSSDTYLISVNAGTKISNIQNKKLEIANALDVTGVRISDTLRVYEGKSYVALEVSKKREKDLIFNKKYLVDMKIPIGKDNLDNVITWDLNNHSTPHMLVCGSTGSGKSVELRSIIEFAKLAGVINIIILDPKFEFCRMGIKGKGVTILSEIEDIEIALEELVKEMNERVKENREEKTLIIFDEFADAQAQGRKGKDLDIMEMVQVGQVKVKGLIGESLQPKMALKKTGSKNTLEENLRILLQKGRSVGFRIVAATQRASAKIITGDAKANFPCQMCFRVPKEIDSRVVLDEAGAESLAGYGDGLFRSPEYPETVRFQAFYKPEK